MKSLRLIVILLFASLPISCAGSVPALQPTPDVNVIVAQTMAARTANAPASTPPPNTSTPLNSSLLPRSLYFLAPDTAAHAWIFRLARDGKTQVQLTAEPADVTACDRNQNDGRIVYLSNNQMLLVNANGSGRQVLFEASPVDENIPSLSINRIQNAVWLLEASFVIMATATNNQMWQGGQAEVVYLDGHPRVTLLPFAREMRWGS